MSQLQLFAQPAKAASLTPSAEEVRAKLEAVLASLRVASAVPWSTRETARWKVVVPQMADWLPEEEARAVRTEFTALLDQLSS